MQYGSEFLPVDQNSEAGLAFQPARSLELMGVIPRTEIPRHIFMKVLSLLSSFLLSLPPRPPAPIWHSKPFFL